MQSFGSKTPPGSEGLRSPELGLSGLGEGPPLAWLPCSRSGEGRGSLGLRGRLSRAAARWLGLPLGPAGLPPHTTAAAVPTPGPVCASLDSAPR